MKIRFFRCKYSFTEERSDLGREKTAKTKEYIEESMPFGKDR
jgi:hypothetical protein